jgi:putative transposase
MDRNVSEQDLRREAIRRHLQGQSRQAICLALSRSLRWFDKWWAEYRHNPHTDFASRSRAPHTSPQQMPQHVIRAVLAARKLLEQASTPATRYGLIGARAIWAHLKQLQLCPLPSIPTIQRILSEHHLTHPLGAASEQAYYPWPLAWELNAIQATDIISKYLHGGSEIQNFHTIDHYSHAVCLTQHLNKTSATARTHLLQNWANLGVPFIQQLDNEGTFCGGHTHRHVLGQVVRTCLFCGVEVLFTPYYEPKRNYQIETFHSLWNAAFWSRHEFGSLDEIKAESPTFRRWYMYHYYPPELKGKAPVQMRRGRPIWQLSAGLGRLLPAGRLPITEGRIHFLRKVDPSGRLELLNESWSLGGSWSGEYVRATITTGKQEIGFWHQAAFGSNWRLIKTRRFRLEETVHALLPEFRRDHARCRDCLPG